MISQEQAEKASDYIRDHAAQYAKAKAERIYLEQFRKSKRAILIQQSKGTVQERDSYAYAHDDYIQILEGLKVAVEREEEIRWKIEAAKVKIELFRTQEASNRKNF